MKMYGWLNESNKSVMHFLHFDQQRSRPGSLQEKRNYKMENKQIKKIRNKILFVGNGNGNFKMMIKFTPPNSWENETVAEL